jgi:hypothetical protein
MRWPTISPGGRRARGSGCRSGQEKQAICSLCGILGANEHWADAAAREGVYTRNADPTRRQRERADRVRLANRVLALYGMWLADGAQFRIACL